MKEKNVIIKAQIKWEYEYENKLVVICCVKGL